MAKAGLTKVANLSVRAREVDFVSRFNQNWEALRQIMGISRPIKKAAGTTLKSYVASVTLANSVGEGESVPYSQATVSEVAYGDITL